MLNLSKYQISVSVVSLMFCIAISFVWLAQIQTPLFLALGPAIFPVMILAASNPLQLIIPEYFSFLITLIVVNTIYFFILFYPIWLYGIEKKRYLIFVQFAMISTHIFLGYLGLLSMGK